MPRDAGLLKRGGTVVEGTAGNTGIGLAHVCNARGYKCVIVMPDNQAAEKYQIIEALGAECARCPRFPYSNQPHIKRWRAAWRRNCPTPLGHQFDNTANRDAHFESTGPKSGTIPTAKIDAFCASTGTGARWRHRPVSEGEIRCGKNRPR